jgi:hypothetical protein
MALFPEFKKTHGPAVQCRPASPEAIRTYRTKLPTALIDEWRESGWCGFAQGLIWTVDPSDFTDVVEDWLEPGDSAVTFMRTAFGDLLVWKKDGAHYIVVSYARVFRLTDDPEILFDYTFCTKNFREKVLDEKLFRKALKKLGPLEHDECYAFEPAIPLGGPGTLATLKKRKLREYLAILAQVSGS